MYKNFNLTESEREQILNMHKEHGYGKPLNEQSGDRKLKNEKFNNTYEWEMPSEERLLNKYQNDIDGDYITVYGKFNQSFGVSTPVVGVAKILRNDDDKLYVDLDEILFKGRNRSGEEHINEQSTMDMNEYSEGFMNKIVDKFKQELTSDVELYVNRFKEISKNLENRDISTYSFEQLKQTVDSYVDGHEKDAIKGLHHGIDKEVERNLPRGSKEARDRYREDMIRHHTQGERPSFSDRYKN